MNRFLKYFGPVAAIVVWALVAKLNLIDPFFLPHPKEAAVELLRLAQTGELTNDATATLWRSLQAFLVAVLVGIPLGLFLGNTEPLYRSVEFIVDFFRSTPATAIFPLFLLVFGVGDISKIAVAAFGALLIVIFNTSYGVINSRKPRTVAAKTMGASPWQVFRWVTFWESLPQTFVGLRSAASLALVIIVVTEMFIGTNFGLGRRIIDSQITYSISAMYAAILVTGFLGYGLNLFLALIEKRYVHWVEKA